MEAEALFDIKPEPVTAEEPKVEIVATEPEVTEQLALEPTPEPKSEPVSEPEDKRVPLATFLDVRDEAKELKRWKAEREAKDSQAVPVEMPDPYDDPTGFAAWNRGNMEQALTAQRFNFSDKMARKEHGAEAVEAAAAWAVEKAKADPGFAQSYMSDSDPIDWIVRQHKRDGLLSDIGDNVDDWFSREAAKRGYAAVSAPNAAPVAVQQQPVAPTPEPPRSLAATPSKGGAIKDIPVGPTTALDGLFTR